ncbi:MAG: PKD domain-containing protein [Verrucomicrobiota bacterium]
MIRLASAGWKFRARPAAALLAALGGFLAPEPAAAQNNPVTTAPVRLRIGKVGQGDWPAKVGVVEIAPCWNAPGRFGVFNNDGKAVAFQSIWAAPGELTRVCFDTSSGDMSYYVCFDNELPLAAGNWKPEAGVLLETRACHTDLPINNAAQVVRLLNAAGAPAGRDFVPNVFLGANPFGPSTYYIASFTGWFTAPSAAQYTFATASDDASYLEVDNHTVATWYGTHGAEEGRHGEHSGTLTLSAGQHRLSYLQIQLGGGSAAVAAWQPPGQAHVELMPASAFGPVARFRVNGCEYGPPGAGRLYFEWRAADQCALGETMFVRTQFRVVDSAPRRTYHWRFDDGSEESGVNPRHFFAEPGLRQVTVEAWQNGAVMATNSVRVRIAPEWQQRDWWRDDVFNQAKSDLLHRDLGPLPARDLTAVWELADHADDAELLMRSGESLMKRQNEFNSPAYGPVFYKTGLVFEHQGDAGDALAEKAFQLALAPQRVAAAIAEPARLQWAGLLVHCDGELEEAGKVLGGIPGSLSNTDDRRRWRLLQGDLSLARGQLEEARKHYAAAGEKPAGGLFNAARAARLESAAILLEHGHWDDAQEAVDRLEFDMPLERMSLDTGLLALKLAMGRKEFQRAFTEGHTLLAVAGGDPRQSEVLFTMVETGLALGKKEEAQKALGRLLKDFPYSEAAAKAKDRWSNK